MSALFPGSPEAERFWRNIIGGVDLFSEVPESHWRIDDYYHPDPHMPDKVYARRGGFLPDVDFSPMDFGIPPNVMPATDTAQLLALRVAQQVLEDAAGGDFSHIDRERISVVLGASGGTELITYISGRLHRPVWERGLRAAGLSERELAAFSERVTANYAPWQENTFPGLLGNVIAGRIANRFDLGGTNCVVDAACASSLAALEVGLHELYLGESDMVIAGGVDAFNDIFMYMCFAKVTALSASGDCRPFSDQSDGTMLGEGLSMFALKRLDDAERNGDRIYAVIRGLGTSSDGRAKSIYAPSPAGQAKALRRAYAAAGYGPETVGLVEAHGTGTKAGDAAEFAALREVFNESGRADRQWCALGSVKSQVGHTKGAAGACGLFKAVMALHHKALPPTIKIDRPNPALEIEQSPFYLSTQAKPWMADQGVPRRASVSSFGFGGTNFHVAVEEYLGTGKRAWRYRSWDSELVVLGAPSAAALSEQAAQLSASLVDSPDMLGWIARSTQAAYNAAQPHRLAVVADSVPGLQTMLNEIAVKLGAADVPLSFASPRGYFYSAQRPGPVALLFPGQGSQYVGMGADLPQLHEPALSAWECARADRLNADRDLHEVVWPKTAFTDDERASQSAELTKTEWAQPGIGAHSLSLLSVIRALGIAPVAVGGHSFGEVSALCAAGVFSGEVALQIARKRGELMAEAAINSDGAMCAVTAPVDQVRQLIGEWGLPVVIANHNAPNQAVLSGNSTAIEHAAQRFAAAGINARRLDVATAFHSDIVSPAAVPFGSFLADVAFGVPEVPVYANATAQPYTGDAQQMRTTLANQIAQPVRFVEQIQAMWRAGARTFIEVGPGGVLTNLVGKCLAGEEHSAVSLDAKGKNGVRSLWIGLAQLVAAGVPMNFERLWADYRVGDDPRNRVQPKLTLKINGSNYGRPPISDEPVRRPSDIDITLDRSDRSNGHRTESESKFMPSESITPVGHVNGTAPAAEPPLPVAPTVLPVAPAAAALNGHAGSNGNGHGAHVGAAAATAVLPAPAALTLPAPRPVAAPAAVPALSAEAVTELIAAVGTLRNGFDQLQRVLEGLVVPSAVAAPPAIANGTPLVVAAPVVPAAPHNGTSTAPLNGTPAPVAAVAAPAPVASAPAVPVGVDLVGQMLDVVADKTGYPVEMLDLSMALEADLGIDSIKRVEILSAVQERVPALPDVETGAMAALGTLQEIVDYLQSLMAPVAPVAHNGTPAVLAAVGAPVPVGVDLVGQMLDVVADKTGYPVEMLDLSMALEADLGIDSIKRVEILSAVQERVPALPDVETGAMAALGTLQEIVDYLQSLMAPVAPVAHNGTPAVLAAVGAPVPVGVDLVGQMLDVVADKTGYPVEMLDLSMALEADLGIDSIKRVEILSAVQERVPALPDVETGAMAALGTLQEIVDYLQSSVVPVAHNGAPPMHAPPPAPAIPNGTVAGDRLPFELAGAAIARHAVRAVAAPASGMAMPGLYSAANVEIVATSPGVGEALAAILRTHGISASTVTEPNVNAEAVIHLGGLQHTTSRADTLALNRVVFAHAQRVATRFEEQGGVFVTVQDTGGTFGLLTEPGSRAWAGGIGALAKTAAQEWPKAQVKAIDIAVGQLTPIAIAEHIAHEILAGGAELEVGLGSTHGRVTIVADATPVATHTRRIDQRDVIVVSGGGRGVTAASVIALAEQTQASFVLIGRTELGDEPPAAQGLTTDAELKRALLTSAAAQGLKLTPKQLEQQVRRILADREVRATLAALTAAGSRVRYATADVRDASQLGALLDGVRADFGPITGLVHGAGVLADAPLHKKTLDGYDRVFETKVGGLCALLDATATDALKLVCLFSSVAARSGNVGQSDYAMANEILNKVALSEQARRGPGCLVRALGWGPWDSGMVTPGLKAMFESRGISLIPLADGARAFVSDVLDAQTVSPEVILGDGVLAGVPTHPVPAEGRVARVVAQAARQPYLLDHRIQGNVVLPIVQALEWFVRMAQACRPGQRVDQIFDLRVLRGVTLHDIDQRGDALLVRCASVEDHPHRLACTLSDASGSTAYYSATVEMGSGAMAIPVPAAAPIGGRQLNRDTCYTNGALFHGPAFQVLESVECQTSTATAPLYGLTVVGWPGEGWATDPAALDGCLQAALVWSHEQLGAKVLPLRVGEIVRYRAGALGDGLRCVLSNGVAKNSRAVCDLDLVDADNLLVASIKRLEMYPYGS
ncbi:type I polyketide synthase [Mycobacterium sp. Aquia_213]|uniref:type I polyketide synthase n=1 Tax=Mycobacterium sp. Aquia_213 TaxID=2991728 RepID=UPI002271B0CA|nr:type I polyketide synthase [Mycobacterium sp. Aquia_213]WAC89973.1 SDR family oxidoreductase [Mycobacterium sp. Aquia_213]